MLMITAVLVYWYYLQNVGGKSVKQKSASEKWGLPVDNMPSFPLQQNTSSVLSPHKKKKKKKKKKLSQKSVNSTQHSSLSINSVEPAIKIPHGRKRRFHRSQMSFNRQSNDTPRSDKKVKAAASSGTNSTGSFLGNQKQK
uniref:Uncharacterized protein n=1 Tax=Haemonchus contortus TaxID=6289 RepID=A0A7I4Y6W0_HAECO